MNDPYVLMALAALLGFFAFLFLMYRLIDRPLPRYPEDPPSPPPVPDDLSGLDATPAPTDIVDLPPRGDK